MDKKDVAKIKKAIGVSCLYDESDPSSAVMRHNYLVFIKGGEEPHILGSTYHTFYGMDQADKELLVDNYRGVLSGSINKKIFDLKLPTGEWNEDLPYATMRRMAIANNKNEFIAGADSIIEKLIDNYMYFTDVVVSFASFEFENESEVTSYVIMSVNASEITPKQLTFETNDKIFDFCTAANSTVNLKKPLDGFMYPILENNQSNVNKILNYSGKSNEINVSFVTNVLGVEPVLTERQEKGLFTQLIKETVGKKTKPEVLFNLYNTISSAYSAEEEPEQRTIPFKSMESIFNSLGVEPERDIKEVYDELFDGKTYNFSVDKILPNESSASIKIENTNTKIAIKPNRLNKVKTVRDKNGEMFLLININEDLITEGLEIDSSHATKITLEENEKSA